jgi:hypothetical protein
MVKVFWSDEVKLGQPLSVEASHGQYRSDFRDEAGQADRTKHQAEIIDYQRRQQVGKLIGSGRLEKAVDQVIGHRRKRKGDELATARQSGLSLA